MKKLIVLLVGLYSFQVSAFTDIRLFVIYSAEAVKNDSSISQSDEYLLNQVALANESFVNSGLDISVSVAERVLYSEFGSFETSVETVESGFNNIRLGSNRDTIVESPIQDFSNPNPDNVHTGLAVDAGADVILYMVSASMAEDLGENICGLARAPDFEEYFTDNQELIHYEGFISMTNGTSGRCSRATLAHELGHLMGSGHLKGGDSVGLYEDSYASSCDGRDTLMGVTSNRLSFFSSPDISENNDVCGDADNANNHRVFSLTAPWLAERITIDDWVFDGNVDLFINNDSLSEDDELEISVVRTGDLSLASSVELMVRGSSGSDLSRFISAGELTLVEFEANEAEKVITLSVASDEESSGTFEYDFYLMNTGKFENDMSFQTVTVNFEAAATGGGTDGAGGPEPDSESSGGGSFGIAFLSLLILLRSRKLIATT